MRVERPHTAQLAMLARDQALLHRRQLDVQILVRQIEIGGEHLGDAVALPRDGEGGRLVAPADAIEIEEASELGLGGVSEEMGCGWPLAWRRRGGRLWRSDRQRSFNHSP